MKKIITVLLSPLLFHAMFTLRRVETRLFGMLHQRVKFPFDAFSSACHGSGCISPTNTPDDVVKRLGTILGVRGGDQEVPLDEKVRVAMQKLGLTPPLPPLGETSDDNSRHGGSFRESECEEGVCSITPPTTPLSLQDTSLAPPPPPPQLDKPEDPSNDISEARVEQAAASLAEDMKVDYSLALASLSATSIQGEIGRRFNIEAAKSMIEHELKMIDEIPIDSPQVHVLVGEGFDLFLSRRALAFAEGNMDDARAILVADKEDEEHDKYQRETAEQKEPSLPVDESQDKTIFPTVTVDSNIDPTRLPTTDTNTASSIPKPAKPANVVFEAESNQIQELVLESPVPVLLDVYADWCGPCKVLTPALEDMARKSGGIFRLVKVNTDKEKPVSTALEVTALPTVFGIKDGRIVHMFQGMPRSEDAMKSFMQGLIVGDNHFDPPLTSDQKAKYESLTTKLVKIAGAASFPFSARERLKDRVQSLLDGLVVQTGDDAVSASESAKVVVSLLSNIIQNQTQKKFRTAKLANAILATKVAPFPAAMGLLKAVGFRQSTNNDNAVVLTLSADKPFVNVAPLVVARDAIDAWIDNSRREVAKAARKLHDESQRIRFHEEGFFDRSDEADDQNDADQFESIDTCLLKVRFAGKKKVYEIALAATDRLSTVLDQLPDRGAENGSDVQITCVAKKLVIRSTDKNMMEEKTLAELGLTPSAALVVDIKRDGDGEVSESTKSNLANRATKKKKKKKGSHSMHSIGIYAKDDNAKAELIDGGGGVWFEHDVSDDEEENEEVERNDQEDEAPPAEVQGDDDS